MMVAKGESKVIYPVVVVKAGGITCRALLDTGAGSYHASAALLELSVLAANQTGVNSGKLK